MHTIFENFNADLYRKVRAARKEANMPHVPHSSDLAEHYCLGKKVLSQMNDKVYKVERVMRQWDNGYYIVLLLERDGSHTTAFWENETSSVNKVRKYILCG